MTGWVRATKKGQAPSLPLLVRSAG